MNYKNLKKFAVELTAKDFNLTPTTASAWLVANAAIANEVMDMAKAGPVTTDELTIKGQQAAYRLAAFGKLKVNSFAKKMLGKRTYRKAR